MKALSIQQPWAWAILCAGKDVENRDWYTNLRGRILIHAGKKIDKNGYCYLYHIMGLVAIPPINELETGGIVGSVEIVDCVAKSESEWFSGKYGFVLKNPITMDFIPYKGALGFFEVSYNFTSERIKP